MHKKSRPAGISGGAATFSWLWSGENIDLCAERGVGDSLSHHFCESFALTLRGVHGKLLNLCGGVHLDLRLRKSCRKCCYIHTVKVGDEGTKVKGKGLSTRDSFCYGN